MGPETARKPGAPTVLLVDDEPDILASLASFLESTMGAIVFTAPTGEDGLKIAAVTKFDLVVSDYRMPGMDGCTFLERVKTLQPGVPLVMVTAYTDAEIERRARKDIGVHRFLLKSVDPLDLLRQLQDVIRNLGVPRSRA